MFPTFSWTSSSVIIFFIMGNWNCQPGQKEEPHSEWSISDVDGGSHTEAWELLCRHSIQLLVDSNLVVVSRRALKHIGSKSNIATLRISQSHPSLLWQLQLAKQTQPGFGRNDHWLAGTCLQWHLGRGRVNWIQTCLIETWFILNN